MKSNQLRAFLSNSIFAAALATVAPAHAFVSSNATVTDNVTSAGPGSWHYEYSVTAGCSGSCNDTIFGVPAVDRLKISDFYVPYFSDGGISMLSSPASWNASIENADLFGLGNGAEVLHWSTMSNPVAVDATLSGFGYYATYFGAKAPFQTVTVNGLTAMGDPLIPASPQAIAAGLVPAAAVPEPQSFALILFGLLGLGLGRGFARKGFPS